MSIRRRPLFTLSCLRFIWREIKQLSLKGAPSAPHTQKLKRIIWQELLSNIRMFRLISADFNKWPKIANGNKITAANLPAGDKPRDSEPVPICLEAQVTEMFIWRCFKNRTLTSIKSVLHAAHKLTSYKKQIAIGKLPLSHPRCTWAWAIVFLPLFKSEAIQRVQAYQTNKINGHAWLAKNPFPKPSVAHVVKKLTWICSWQLPPCIIIKTETRSVVSSLKEKLK